MRCLALWLLALLSLIRVTAASETAGLGSIDALALFRWLDTPDPPLLLDVRGRKAYLSGSVPGALDAGKDPAGFLPDSRGGDVVLILAEGVEPEPWRERLADFGYRVHILAGGMGAWRAAGFTVEKPAEGFVQPGTVPFLIPRGICELNEPAEVYD